MKLVIKKITNSSLSVGVVVKKLYKEKNIQISRDPNILNDFLQINEQERIYGALSILKHLDSDKNQSQREINTKFIDNYWQFLYIQPDSVICQTGVNSNYINLANEILSQYGNFQLQENIKEIDIILFLSLMQIPSLPLYPKFRHLENWFQFVHNQISYDLKKLFIQELGQNEDQYNKLFNFEQIFKQNQQTKKTIEENEYLQPHTRDTVSIKYDKIIPDEKEQILIDFLKEFIKNENLKVVLRCAGGWVRDKLLGVKSHDIDIALDSMMGEQFVTKLQEYSKKIGEPISSVGVIKANPDQSKHLETATCKVKGFDIDFVNLRGEYYAENSRIPTITFGSPTQDAERRDLTINSLFYNINEDKLEDFCGRGVQDLQNGICMTPLEPLKTFLDDPLRVLRTFRFASRYNYTIDKSLLEAIQQTKVKEALKEKVSRERMRTETEKMIRSRNPFLGLQMIHENNLWDVVFEVPKELEKKIQDDKIIDISYNFAKKTNEQYLSMRKNISKCQLGEEDFQFLFFFSSTIYPYHKYEILNQKKKTITLSQFIGETSLKFGKNDSDNIVKLNQGIDSVKKIVKMNKNDEQYFLNIVKFIVNLKDLWEIALELAYNYDIVYEQQQELEKNYIQLKNYIVDKNLDQIYLIKPLLNGQEVQELYGKGRIVGVVTKNLLLWQYKNYGKGKEDLIQAVNEDKQKEQQNQFFTNQQE